MHGWVANGASQGGQFILVAAVVQGFLKHQFFMELRLPMEC